MVDGGYCGKLWLRYLQCKWKKPLGPIMLSYHTIPGFWITSVSRWKRTIAGWGSQSWPSYACTSNITFLLVSSEDLTLPQKQSLEEARSPNINFPFTFRSSIESLASLSIFFLFLEGHDWGISTYTFSSIRRWECQFILTDNNSKDTT